MLSVNATRPCISRWPPVAFADCLAKDTALVACLVLGTLPPPSFTTWGNLKPTKMRHHITLNVTSSRRTNVQRISKWSYLEFRPNCPRWLCQPLYTNTMNHDVTLVTSQFMSQGHLCATLCRRCPRVRCPGIPLCAVVLISRQSEPEDEWCGGALCGMPSVWRWLGTVWECPDQSGV